MSDFENNSEMSKFGKKKDRDFMEWWDDAPIGHRVGAVIGFAILGIGLLFLFGFVVMSLWNWLMPEIFGLKTIDYWQTWGLLLLSMIFFKGFGNSPNNARSDRKRRRTLKKKLEEASQE